MFKQIMIPVAAFAVTVTGASAFNSDMLQELDINLTDTEISALEEAHEVRQESREEAKEILEDAGIDQTRHQEIREAMHEARDEHRAAMHEVIEAGDYDAFLEVADEKMLENIDSEADFDQLVEAQALREAGDHEGAKEIMEELGFERSDGGEHRGMHGHGQFGGGEGFGPRD